MAGSPDYPTSAYEGRKLQGVWRLAVLYTAPTQKERRRPVSCVPATLLSACADLRKQMFELIAAMERECHCEIDPEELMKCLDEIAPRTELTDVEAQRILLAISRNVNGRD